MDELIRQKFADLEAKVEAKLGAIEQRMVQSDTDATDRIEELDRASLSDLKLTLESAEKIASSQREIAELKSKFTRLEEKLADSQRENAELESRLSSIANLFHPRLSVPRGLSQSNSRMGLPTIAVDAPSPPLGQMETRSRTSATLIDGLAEMNSRRRSESHHTFAGTSAFRTPTEARTTPLTSPPVTSSRVRSLTMPDESNAVVTLTQVFEHCDFYDAESENNRISHEQLAPAVFEILKPQLAPFRTREGFNQLTRVVRRSDVHCARHKLMSSGRDGNGPGMVMDLLQPCSTCADFGLPCVRRHKDVEGGRALIVPAGLRSGEFFDKDDPQAWVKGIEAADTDL